MQVQTLPDYKAHIRVVENFPKKGLKFYDISPLLANPMAWENTMADLLGKVQRYHPDYLIGVESRGFLAAAPLAYELGLGFALVRKKGKLPGPVIEQVYDLEYGDGVLEVQTDIIPKGSDVFILDDVLATGGTMAASVSLLERAGMNVKGAACILELESLKGRKNLGEIPFYSLIQV